MDSIHQSVNHPSMRTGCWECGNSFGHYPSCSQSTKSFTKLYEIPSLPKVKIGCSECGKEHGHYSYCSKSLLSLTKPSVPPILPQVKTWVPVINTVIGTCRNCGHRGIVDDPCIAIY